MATCLKRRSFYINWQLFGALLLVGVIRSETVLSLAMMQRSMKRFPLHTCPFLVDVPNLDSGLPCFGRHLHLRPICYVEDSIVSE